MTNADINDDVIVRKKQKNMLRQTTCNSRVDIYLARHARHQGEGGYGRRADMKIDDDVPGGFARPRVIA